MEENNNYMSENILNLTYDEEETYACPARGCTYTSRRPLLLQMHHRYEHLWKPNRRDSQRPRRATESPRQAAESPRQAAESPRQAAESPRQATGSPRQATESPRRPIESPDQNEETEPRSTPSTALQIPTITVDVTPPIC